jgi:hypothetical protein
MQIREKKGFNIKLVLDRLSQSRELKSDGSISISRFGLLEDYEAYLRSAIEFKGKTDAFARRVVRKAMSSEQEMNPDRFIEHCRRISGIEENSQRVFKVLFPIWGSVGALSGRRRWGDVSITFDINRDSRFAQKALLDRAKQLKRHIDRSARVFENFDNLPLALCTVKGADVYDAFEQAENAISKELGLYSLISQRGQFIVTSEPDRPINTILLAPHMTVHDASGSISADIIWYNRWPTSMTSKTRSVAELERIFKNVDRVRRSIRDLPWRDRAENALIRHYSAFSQCDLESSFLDGWRLLESVGGNGAEKGETLVRRASWFFEDREFQFEVGRHLMERRNLISHGRPVRDESNESLAFQMKRFLRPLLLSFLTNPYKFQNLDEFWGFCDLPVDRQVRARRAYLLECSRRFRQEG